MFQIDQEALWEDVQTCCNSAKKKKIYALMLCLTSFRLWWIIYLLFIELLIYLQRSFEGRCCWEHRNTNSLDPFNSTILLQSGYFLSCLVLHSLIRELQSFNLDYEWHDCIFVCTFFCSYDFSYVKFSILFVGLK